MLARLLKLNEEVKENHQDKINIVCIKPTINMLQAILNNSSMFISVLFLDRWNTNDDNYADYYKLIEENSSRIGRIIIEPCSYEEFNSIFNCDYSLDLQEIALYRDAQLDSYRYNMRSMLPLTEMDYRYFIVLKFWLFIIKHYSVKFVFSNIIYHGEIIDLIVKIAMQQGIPSYIFEEQIGTPEKCLCGLKLISKETVQYIKLSDIIEKKHIDISDYLFNHVTVKENSFKNLNWVKLKKRFRFFLNWLKLSKKDYFELRAKKYQDYCTYGILEIAKCISYEKELAKRYAFYSQQIDEKDKFVYFPLHFEPEARTLNSTAYTNQLFLIQMISENLPEGWTLYVKEHPGQFLSHNNVAYWFFLYSYKNFRPDNFYIHLKNMKNVKLIDINVPAKELVEKSKAVISLIGTVIYESIVKNKPLLYLGGLGSICNQFSCIYHIQTGTDIYNALSAIDNNEVLEQTHFNTELNEYAMMFLKDYNVRYNFDYVKDYSSILNWIINKVTKE